MGKVRRHTLGASLNIRHNLSSSKGPKPLQLKLLTTYIPKTSAFTLAFSTSQRLQIGRASCREREQIGEVVAELKNKWKHQREANTAREAAARLAHQRQREPRHA